MVGAPYLSGRQKLRSALLLLATQPVDVFHRLETAYQLALLTVDSQIDLPPERKEEFEKIRAELQATFLNPTRRTFANETEREQWASHIAGQLVDFYDALIKTK